MQRTLDVTFDEIVIGCNLSALSYAYKKNLPLIFLRQQKPSRFVDPDVNLIKKYNDLLFILSFNSKIPFSNLLNSIRIINPTLLKAFTKSNICLNLKVNKIVIADDFKIEGLPESYKKDSTKNLVFDYFYLGIPKKNLNKELRYESDLIKKIYLIKEPKKKINYDCVVVSYINDEDLDKFEYSQTFIKLNIMKFLKKNSKSGISEKREIFPLGKNIYQNIPDNISFLDEYHEIPEIIISEKKKFYV